MSEITQVKVSVTGRFVAPMAINTVSLQRSQFHDDGTEYEFFVEAWGGTEDEVRESIRQFRVALAGAIDP